MDYKSLVRSCDDDLKAGRGQAAASRLAKINPSAVEREWRLPLARLCRRTGLVSMGLKLLSPLARTKNKRTKIDVTAPEVAEYAALLNLTGASREAARLLAGVDAKEAPQVQLFRAFCHVTRWEYAAAIPHLRAYIQNEADAYMKLVGSVNLASALVFVDAREEAAILLDELVQSAAERGYKRLAANCLEMRAQVYLAGGDFSKARRALEEAHGILQHENTTDQFFVRKWTAVVDALEHGKTGALATLRDEALARGDTESVRETDLFLLRARFDEAKFHHLFFGTPFGDYREHVCKALGRRPEITEYVRGNENAPVFDIRTGEFPNRRLPPGKLGHRLIATLARDFYRPASLGGLFAELFPGDVFDIFSSPDRVHQVLRRTRRWLEAEGLPIEITEAGGRYRLGHGPEVAFLIPSEIEPIDWYQVQCHKLATSFGEGVFTPREGRAALELSPASFTRVTSWALEHARLERFGKGNEITYRLKAA